MHRSIKIIIAFLSIMYSCDNKKDITINDKEAKTSKVDTVFVTKNSDSLINSEYFFAERLPDWFVKSKILNKLIINKSYQIENRLNPFYLEEDFNGDGSLDIAIPIFEIETNKKGFAIVHGGSFDVFIIGAGKTIKNGLGENEDYIDIWRINRNEINSPGVEEETGNSDNGDLILKNPSLEILKSESGGGLIYWNGKEYAYFHQTC